MIKAKFRERIRSKTDTAQINEMLLMVLCHCICVVIQSMYELNIELTLGAESSPALNYPRNGALKATPPKP